MPGQLPVAVARNESREYAAYVAGPPIGGLLLGISQALPFVTDSISYLISLTALTRIRRPLQEPRAATRSRLWTDVRQGFVYLWQTPFLRTTTLLSGGGNFVSNGIGLGAIIISKQHGASAAQVGLMLTISGIGGFAGSLLAARIQTHLSPRQVLIIGTCTWTGLVALVTIARSPWTLGAILAVLLFTAPPWNAIIEGKRIALTPDHLRGRVDSAGSIFSVGLVAFGTLASGYLLEHLGPTATAALFAACMACVAAVASFHPAVRIGLIS